MSDAVIADDLGLPTGIQTKHVVIVVSIAMLIALFTSLVADFSTRLLRKGATRLGAPSWVKYALQGGLVALVFVALVLVLEFGVRRPISGDEATRLR